MAIINVKSLIPSFEDISFTLPIGVSVLGTLMYDDIKFPAGSYKTLQGNIVEYEEFSVQSVAMIVSQAKNIVKTQISGRNGTVKEYNNSGDFEISISANINELIAVFPADQMQTFRELVKVPESIPVISKILNSIFEIDNVVLNDFSFSPNQGKGNVSLNMSLSSDLPFNIKDFEV